jgi:hypothetical protein
MQPSLSLSARHPAPDESTIMLGSVTGDVSQTEARLIGAIERIISVAPKAPSSMSGPDAADDAIDMLEQVRAGAPDGSDRRQWYDRLLGRLREWNASP